MEDILAELRDLRNKKKQGIPLFFQIRETLQRQIIEGHLKVGDQLPSIAQLAEAIGVSQVTVRRAMDKLVEDRMLRRQPGVGTIVTSQKIIRDHNRLINFDEEMRQRNLHVTSRFFERQIVQASPSIVSALHIKTDQSVIHLRRVREIAGRVMALNEVYVPFVLCPWLMDIDMENQSLYKLYEAHCLRQEWGQQHIEAATATPEQAEYLHVEPGASLLFIERLTYTADNLPIELIEAYYPAGAYSVKMTLRR
jgi:GntR family transcriptional regulator